MGKNFNGSSDYYQVGGGNIASGDPKWFSLWFKVDNLPGSEACLYARQTVTVIGSYIRYVAIILTSSGSIRIRQYYQDAFGVGIRSASSSISITTGQWYHVLARNSFDYRVIWINGGNKGTDSNTLSTAPYREIWVAALNSSMYFDGTIIDVCEWENGSATEAEGDLIASAIYNGYISPQFYWANSLLLFYPFFSDHAYSYGSSQMTLTKNGSPSDAEHLPILYPEDCWYQYKSRETGMQGWDPQIILPHQRKLVVVEY